jgi:hypothetical protein
MTRLFSFVAFIEKREFPMVPLMGSWKGKGWGIVVENRFIKVFWKLSATGLIGFQFGTIFVFVRISVWKVFTFWWIVKYLYSGQIYASYLGNSILVVSKEESWPPMLVWNMVTSND